LGLGIDVTSYALVGIFKEICLQLQMNAMLLPTLATPGAPSDNCFEQPLGMLASLLISLEEVIPVLLLFLGLVPVN
jgi:hypothetical protein